jgi:hypothetical protein
VKEFAGPLCYNDFMRAHRMLSNTRDLTGSGAVYVRTIKTTTTKG